MVGGGERWGTDRRKRRGGGGCGEGEVVGMIRGGG